MQTKETQNMVCSKYYKFTTAWPDPGLQILLSSASKKLPSNFLY